MKAIITLLVVAIGFFALAQNGKGNGKGNDKSGKGHSKNSHIRVVKPIKGAPKMKKAFNSDKGNKSLKPVGKSKSHPNAIHHSKGNKGFKPKQFHYKKGHSNHIYMYHFGPVVYPTKNYGQWRSQQARNKHKKYKPKAEKDALSAIIMINDRNSFLLLEIGRKIDRYEQLVIAKHRSGGLTNAEFSLRVSAIESMRRKQSSFSLYMSI